MFIKPVATYQMSVFIHIFIVTFILFRYVLISKPTEWSDDLRKKFLEGFDAFLELLKCMQVCIDWHISQGSTHFPPPFPFCVCVCAREKDWLLFLHLNTLLSVHLFYFGHISKGMIWMAIILTKKLLFNWKLRKVQNEWDLSKASDIYCSFVFGVFFRSPLTFFLWGLQIYLFFNMLNRCIISYLTI